MKIKTIGIKDFKRFTNLTIKEIPDVAKVIIVVGPNGSGKSSLFDALLHWYRYNFQSSLPNGDYYVKKGSTGKVDGNNIRIEFHDFIKSTNRQLKGKFYFRSAYRNDADFTANGLQQQSDPTEEIRLNNFIQNDMVVQQNYQRLVSLTLAGVYDENNNNISVLQLRNELIGKIQHSLSNVFEDLNLSSIGDPLRNGSFYFEKGMSKDFHYKNLSGGEKSAFDLILDLIIKSSYYQEAIYCIDEPETHMHTRLQSKLFEEIYRLIPEGSQLWINTHSLGMLKKAREIEKKIPNSISFLNFGGIDFDVANIIVPSKIDKTIWEKFVEITLDDFSELLAPQTVVFCEGSQKGRLIKGFDAAIYSKIFNNKYPDSVFISIGSASEIENENNITFKVINDVLKGSNIIKLVDRDDKSPEEINELKLKLIKVLENRHIESYLLEDEIIIELCNKTNNSDKIPYALELKYTCLSASVTRGNPSDDIKSATGEIYVGLKKLLSLTACGNNKDTFLRDTLCPLVTEETEVYKTLERIIFS